MEQSLPGPALQPCVPVAELQHKGPNLLLTRLRLRPTHAPAPAAAAAAAILRCRGLPSRTLSSPFSDPEASQRLSGLMASLTTPVVCPFMVCTHALARMSHTLTLQSMDPEASSLPKGLYCTTRQLLRCWDSERSTGGGGGGARADGRASSGGRRGGGVAAREEQAARSESGERVPVLHQPLLLLLAPLLHMPHGDAITV
jgi:hypothetical protein